MWYVVYFAFSSYKCASKLCLPAVLFDLVSLPKRDGKIGALTIHLIQAWFQGSKLKNSWNLLQISAR
jgi:hypothetical protein